MRNLRIASAAAVMAFGLAIAPTQAALKITEVMSASGQSGALGNDWFELTNTGSTAVTFTGYTMDDNSYGFATSVSLNGVTSIAGGESVVFMEVTGTGITTPATPISTFKSFWGLGASAQVGYYSGSGVSLGATGDGVIVFNSGGTEQNRVAFGAATTGSSFDTTSNQTTPPISVVGVNGAYNAPDATAPQNVGSPDFAPTPEPGTLGVLAVASLAVLRRRR